LKNSQENYIVEIIPQILINSKDIGCIGGDWNCLVEKCDPTKIVGNKLSNSLTLKMVVNNLVLVIVVVAGNSASLKIL
jgi:hypothetical protein